MADKLMRAQVTIPLDSGVPEDVIVNTLYFDGDDGLTDAIYHAHVMTHLTTFYQAIDGVLFGQNVASPATVKIYDMRDAEPRVPEYTDTITLSPLASGIDLTLPNEVALCLSFKASVASGENAKRRRGRIYLGPVHYDAAEMVSSQARPKASVRTAVAAAAGVMADALGEDPGPKVSWAIYSPTTDLTSTLDDAFFDVQSGWVDNAFDTQRRRGAAATARTTFS